MSARCHSKVFLFKTKYFWFVHDKSRPHGARITGSQIEDILDRVSRGYDFGFLDISNRNRQGALAVTFRGTKIVHPKTKGCLPWFACAWGRRLLCLRRDTRVRIRYIKFVS